MSNFIRRYPVAVFLAFLLGLCTEFIYGAIHDAVRPPLSERRFIVKETSDDRYTLVMDMVTGCQYLSSSDGGIVPLQTLGDCNKDLAKPDVVKVP